jgi:hypothetical protein
MLYPAELRARIYFSDVSQHLRITGSDVNGAPGTIRTSDPQIRSLMLYPAELRARMPFLVASSSLEPRVCGAPLKMRITYSALSGLASRAG